MSKVEVYNICGEKVGELELLKEVFDVEIKKYAVHQVVVAQLANKRQGTHSAKTRSEVSGGGKKPWRQKGTGRARQGSIRAPQWIHGGVVFAPKPRDYRMSISKTLRRAAITSVLTSKLKEKNLLVLNEISFDFPKTKEMVKIMNNLKIDSNMLLVTETSDKNVYRSGTNLQSVKVLPVNNINVYDLLKYDKLVITQGALKKLEEVYSN
ncbi:50S ribosomal protein L4 [Candidatus Arthromitus sp. SFB-rat-Yit]|uniref:50S ribosomal protein L4 n=1 Tax=Candidatus Arthromitus sp. SFB-rat-Yit TaxID=1041504 RepID=UPI000227A80D|nr:50S ribosomal protein L4 [Candidatus Arthromitus sp. SFB-rat-Yit]BAK81786.1 50S ribosomal protein L4 [Candidatus Arthromitus sp. SFB-rat-Yit]